MYCPIDLNPVHSVRFSADGKYLAAALKDGIWHNNGTIIIYDIEAGKRICVLAEYASKYASRARPGIHCVCFSPDGKYVIFGDTASHIIVWDLPHKRVRNIFRGHDGSVRSLDFSPNGRLVASASLDGTMRIWNMQDGSAKVFSDNANGFWSVKFSPDGQYVAAGNSDWILRIWDVRTGQLVRRWTGHRGTIWSVAFMPDGRGLVSGSGDGVVKLLDVKSLGIVQSGGEPAAMILESVESQTHSVYSIAVSPDARWVAASLSNNTSIIWDADSAIPQCTLIGHSEAVSSVDFSPMGNHLALGSHDRYVSIWRYTRTWV